MELSPECIERLSRKGVDPKILAKILASLDNAQTPSQLSGFESDKPGDSLPLQGSDSQAAGGPEAASAQDSTTRISRSQLFDLLSTMSERDKQILAALYKYRFLFTNQIQRLYFTEAKDKRSNTINANRMLKKLKEQGLIAPLKRRSLGYRSGSVSLIWHLTSAGYRLLNLMDADKYPRKSFDEPSTMFLAHTLAIAETAVQLSTICTASGDISLKNADPEPSCWRPFKDNGRQVFLKPDLYAVTVTDYGHGDRYEDSWFIEMDLGTEAPTQVVEKCQAYLRYYNTGTEQEKKGVFPVVVWLVKDEARKQKLRQYIRESLPPQPKMFLVITPDQLGKMVRNFIESEELC